MLTDAGKIEMEEAKIHGNYHLHIPFLGVDALAAQQRKARQGMLV